MPGGHCMKTDMEEVGWKRWLLLERKDGRRLLTRWFGFSVH